MIPPLKKLSRSGKSHILQVVDLLYILGTPFIDLDYSSCIEILPL